MLAYISFPPAETILSRLRLIDGGGDSRESFFKAVADHLGGRTIESAAFCFLLIELVHRHVQAKPEELEKFVPRCVFALTGDRELSEAARAALNEIGPDNKPF